MAANDIVVRAILDDSGFVRTWQNISREIKTNTSMWKSEFRQLSTAGNWTEAYESKLKGLKRTEEMLRNEQKDLTRDVKDLENANQQGTAKWEKATLALQKNTSKLNENQLQQKRAAVALDRSKQGLQEIERRYQSTDREMKVHKALLESQGKQYTANRVHMNGLMTMYGQLNEKLNVQKNSLKTVDSELGKNSNEYKKLSDEIAETQLKMTSFANEAKVLSANSLGSNMAVNRMGDSFKKINNSLISTGQHMQNIGNNAFMMSATMGVAIASGVKNVMELDKAYKVNENLLSTSGENVVEVTKNISEMRENGRQISLKYGISQKEIADGYEELIRRGYDGSQAVSAMNDIVQASVASGDDLGETLKVTTAVMEGFNMGAANSTDILSDTRTVANQLAYAADTTATDFHGLGIAMTYVSQASNSVGYSVADTSSALGILSNNGLEADKAGTGLRKVITSLAAPTATASDTLKELGVQVTDSSGKFKAMPDIFEQLHDALAKLPQDQQLGALKAIFGQTGLQAAGILSGHFEDLRKEIVKVNDAATSTGAYIQRLADSNMETPANQMKIFKAALDDLSMSFSRELLPTINSAMKDAEKLMHWFGNLDDGTKKLIVSTALWGTGLGLAMKPLGMLTSGIGQLGNGYLGLLKILSKVKSISTAGKVAKEAEQVGASVLKVTKGTSNALPVFSELESKLLSTGKASRLASTGLAAAGTESAVASTGAAGLGTAFLSFIGPAAAVAAAVGLVAGGLYLYSKHQQKAREEQKKANQEAAFGTQVTKQQRVELENLQQSADAVQQEVSKIKDVKLDTENVKDAAAAWRSWADVLTGDNADSIAKNEEKIKNLQDMISDPSTSQMIKDAAQNEINALQGKDNAYKSSSETIQKAQDDVTNILNSAANEHRKLTKTELSQIEADKVTMMKEAINNNNDLTKKQKEDVIKMLSNDDITKLPLARLQEANKEYGRAMKATMADSVAQVNEEVKNGLSKSTAWKDFFQNNMATIKPLINNFNAELKKIDWSDTAKGVKQYGDAYDNMKSSVEAAGIDWGEFAKQFHIANKNTVDDMTGTASESKAMRKAFGDSVADMIRGTQEWNSLNPEEKALIVDDKASQKFLGAAQKSGMWDKISPEEKKLILQDLASGKVDDANQKLNAWKAFNVPPKTVKANDAASKVLKSAGISVKDWNKLTPKQQKAVGRDLASGNFKGAKSKVDAWNRTKPKDKTAKGHDNAQAITNAKGRTDAWNRTHPGSKTAHGSDSAHGITNAKGRLDAWNWTNPGHKTAHGSATGTGSINSAIDSLERFARKPNIISKVIETIFRTRSDHKAIGDSDYKGGSVWLGDGGKNEPYMTPDGQLGVSPSDWTLTNLPAGTKIWPSMSAFHYDTGKSINPSLIPKFATGGTINSVMSANDNFSRSSNPTVIDSQLDSAMILNAISELAKMVASQESDTVNINVMADMTDRTINKVSDRVENVITRKQNNKSRVYGGR